MMILTMVLAAVGLAAVLWALTTVWFRPLDGAELVLRLCGEEPTLEQRVRALLWLRAGLGNVRIVLTDDGLEPAAREAALRLCADHWGIRFEERRACTWMTENN